MRAVRRGLVAGFACLVLGALAALAVVVGLPPEQRVPPPLTGDRLEQALEVLGREHVHVTPDGRSMMDQASEEELEQALAAAPVPVRVVVWAPSDQAGNASYSPATTIANALGPDQVTIVWEGPGRADTEVADGQLFLGTLVAEGDAATRIAEFSEALEPDDIETDTAGADETREAAGGGVGLGLFGYGLLMLAVGVVRLLVRRPFLVPGPYRKA